MSNTNKEETYKRGLERLNELDQEYWLSHKTYKIKQEELSKIQEKITITEKKLEDLNTSIGSIDILKKKMLEQAESNYKKQIDEAKKLQEQAKREIIHLEEQDQEVEISIKQKYERKLDHFQSKVKNVNTEIDHLADLVANAQEQSRDLEYRIQASAEKENQIRACAMYLEPEYAKVSQNAEFIKDYRDPRGATPEEAREKFLNMPPGKIKKIADKMNRGLYVSSPDESKGFPIMEIILAAFSTLFMVLKGIIQSIGFMYKPVFRFRKFKHKLIYSVVITIFMLLLLDFISWNYGGLIKSLVKLCFNGVWLSFLGMVAFNIFKYSNKAFRKEQNLAYYTVGYYFTFEKDEIMFKIASDYFAKLKEKNSDEIQNILQAVYGELEQKKIMIQEDMISYEQQLEGLTQKLTDTQEQISKEKLVLEEECKKEISDTLLKRQNEREKKGEQAQKDYELRLEKSKIMRQESIQNAEQDAIMTMKKQEQEIILQQEELKKLHDEVDCVNSELNKIYNMAEEQRQENHVLAEKYKKYELNIVEQRTINDQIPDTLVAGINGCISKNMKTHQVEKIYEVVKIKYNKKPIIITCDIADDESIEVTKNYYSLIDSLIGDLLTKTYIGAFRFVLIDSQGSKRRIVDSMETCCDCFEELEKYGCLSVLCDNASKSFDAILKEQESKLDGKNIDDINEKNKNLDNMIRYHFVCVRMYSNKTSDFPISDFRKRIDNALNNGIIPIIIMSHNYFLEKKNDLEGTIRELCENHYYTLGMTNGSHIHETKLEEKTM